MDMLKFRIYPEGELDRVKVVEASGAFNAARAYAEEHIDSYLIRKRPTNLVVIPMFHVEMGDGSPWKSDKEEPIYRLFVVRPSVMWEAQEVSTFNPRQLRDLGPKPYVDEVWGYASSAETEGWRGGVASRDDAIAAGRALYGTADNEIGHALDHFWIVGGTRPDPAMFIHDAKTIVEWMSETARESEDYDSDTISDFKATTVALAELDAFLKAWARKHTRCAFWQANGEPEKVPVVEAPSNG